jgi:hypothetical protein
MMFGRWAKIEKLITPLSFLFVLGAIAIAFRGINQENRRRGEELASPAEQKRIEEERVQEQTAKARRLEIEQAVFHLAVDHNAVTDWQQTLTTHDLVGPTYSAELSKVLIRPDGRPLLFVAELQDVALVGDNYECVFSDKTRLLLNLELILRCSPSVANQVMSLPRMDRLLRARYAVVGLISTVQSVEEKLKGEDGDEPATSKKFVANGECEGLVHVGFGYR